MAQATSEEMPVAAEAVSPASASSKRSADDSPDQPSAKMLKKITCSAQNREEYRQAAIDEYNKIMNGADIVDQLRNQYRPDHWLRNRKDRQAAIDEAYNKNMNGVDIVDQLRNQYRPDHWLRNRKDRQAAIDEAYNKNMNGVDIVDQLRNQYRPDHWLRNRKR